MKFGLVLWGFVAFLGASLGWTPEWLGRPTAAVIGVIFVAAGCICFELDRLREQRK